MEHLWTPWRLAYVKGERKAVDDCVFCLKAAHPKTDAAEHVIARSSHTFAALNRFPYANGHVMIVPYQHLASQEDMDTAALTDLMVMTNRAMRVLRECVQPAAFNIGANIGAAAGAGIAAHFHFHIVPRWTGDVNFMTSIGNTRVIPDTVERSYGEIKAIWERLYPSSAPCSE